MEGDEVSGGRPGMWAGPGCRGHLAGAGGRRGGPVCAGVSCARSERVRWLAAEAVGAGAVRGSRVEVSGRPGRSEGPESTAPGEFSRLD